MAELMDYSNLLSDPFKVRIPDRPTFSLLRSKAGVIGRPIKETGGTVVDQVAARSGVIRVGNGFRCPDTMTNGGTFTDATGSTCGVRIVTGAVEEVVDQLRSTASNPGTDRPRLSTTGFIGPRLPTQVQTDVGFRVEGVLRNLNELMHRPREDRRVRLTVSELLPEVFGGDPTQAVEMVIARRPQRLWPRLDGPIEQSWDITQGDIDSDTYIRSLGAAVLADLESQSKEVQERLGKLRLIKLKQAQQSLEAKARNDEALKLLSQRADVLSTYLRELLDLEGVVYNGRFSGRYGKIVDGKIDPSSIGVGSDREEGSVDLVTHTFEAEFDGKDFIVMRVITAQVKNATAPDLDDGGVKPLVEFDYWNTKGTRERSFVPDLNGTEAQVAAARALDFFTTGFMSGPSEREAYLASVADDVKAGHSASPLTGIIDAERRVRTTEAARDAVEKSQYISSDPHDVVRTALYDTMKRHGFVAGSLEVGDMRSESDEPDRDDLMLRMHHKDLGFAVSKDFSSVEAEQLAKAIDSALQMMPKSWADVLKKTGIRFFKDPSKPRGYARERAAGGTEINIPTEHFLWRGDLETLVIHELTHAVQNTDRRISEAEYIFFRRRNENLPDGSLPPTVKLNELIPERRYGDDEIAVPDDADDAYMFKLYYGYPNEHRSARISELSAVAMQHLQGKRSRFDGDLDMQSFMIGLLMEYGVPREQT